MKYFLISIFLLINIHLFSQNKIIVDSIYTCHIINNDLIKTIDKFFLYEDSLWNYNQNNKTFTITIETIKQHEFENVDSVTNIIYLLCLRSGFKHNTFKYLYSQNCEKPIIYYVTNYKNRKIVFILDEDAIPFVECLLRLDNKIAVKVYPNEIFKYNRGKAKQLRTYWKFEYNKNCEQLPQIYSRNYKNVPLKLRKY